MNSAKVDLHLHLDGSLYMPWAYKKALERKVISEDCTFEEYYWSYFSTEYKTRVEGFKRFEIPISILQHYEDLSDATYTLIELLAKQGLIYAEIRFAPSQHCKAGLTQKEAVEAVMDGVKRAKKVFDIEIGIINCLMHKGENALFNMDDNMETVMVTKELLGDIVVGLDLAGYENNGEFTLYEPLFKKAHELNIPYTIHAGEMGEGKHVHDALMMKASRIGHGVNCVQDEKWLKEVVDTQIPLEVCLSSNVKKDHNYAAHPIRQLLAANAKVTINTDNLIFAQTNLQNEHNQLMALGVSEEQLLQCTKNAIDAAFCSQEVKEKLYKKL